MVLKYAIAREQCFGAGAAYWVIHHQVVTKADPSDHLKESFLQNSDCKNPKYYFSKLFLLLFLVNCAGLMFFNAPSASAVFISFS